MPDLRNSPGGSKREAFKHLLHIGVLINWRGIMSEPIQRRSVRGAFRRGILGGLLILCTVLAIYIGLVLHINVAYTHLFYVPIVLGGLWYFSRGILVGLYLGALYLMVEVLGTGSIDTFAWIRAVSFIGVALVVGYVSTHIQNREKKAIEYLDSYARRLSPPQNRVRGTFDGIRISLGMNMDVEKMRERGDAEGLISALRHKNPEVRYQAAEALGTLKNPISVPALETGLHDPDRGVRWKAAEALGRIGEEAVPALDRACRDTDDDVRWRAVLALGRIDGRRVLPSLLAVLEDRDPYVRDRAVITLGEQGREILPDLLERLRDPDPRRRIAVLPVLKQLKDPEAQAALARTLSDADEQVRDAAAMALGVH